jgi:hypothetical protein
MKKLVSLVVVLLALTTMSMAQAHHSQTHQGHHKKKHVVHHKHHAMHHHKSTVHH